jgi:hypothetical protein
VYYYGHHKNNKEVDIMTYRKGEAESTHFRSERFFAIGSDWYFSTREGLDLGPYTDRQEAEAALLFFIREKRMEPNSLG